MTHQLVLDLPDDVYEPLARQAEESGKPVEALATECLARSVALLGPSEALLRTAGMIDADIPDLCDRLDDYLGEGLAEDLREPSRG